MEQKDEFKITVAEYDRCAADVIGELTELFNEPSDSEYTLAAAMERLLIEATLHAAFSRMKMLLWKQVKLTDSKHSRSDDVLETVDLKDDSKLVARGPKDKEMPEAVKSAVDSLIEEFGGVKGGQA